MGKKRLQDIFVRVINVRLKRENQERFVLLNIHRYLVLV